MDKQVVFQSLEDAGIVPVIRSSSSKKVLQIAEALMKREDPRCRSDHDGPPVHPDP